MSSPLYSPPGLPARPSGPGRVPAPTVVACTLAFTMGLYGGFAGARGTVHVLASGNLGLISYALPYHIVSMVVMAGTAVLVPAAMIRPTPPLRLWLIAVTLIGALAPIVIFAVSDPTGLLSFGYWLATLAGGLPVIVVTVLLMGRRSRQYFAGQATPAAPKGATDRRPGTVLAALIGLWTVAGLSGLAALVLLLVAVTPDEWSPGIASLWAGDQGTIAGVLAIVAGLSALGLGLRREWARLAVPTFAAYGIAIQAIDLAWRWAQSARMDPIQFAPAVVTYGILAVVLIPLLLRPSARAWCDR